MKEEVGVQGPGTSQKDLRTLQTEREVLFPLYLLVQVGQGSERILCSGHLFCHEECSIALVAVLLANWRSVKEPW